MFSKVVALKQNDTEPWGKFDLLKSKIYMFYLINNHHHICNNSELTIRGIIATKLKKHTDDMASILFCHFELRFSHMCDTNV